jgi:DamX protein
MSGIANSAAEPSYLSRLALQTAPFNSAIKTDAFFHGEQIEQRLNLLSHLVRASDKVPCVFAVEGGGKSALLNELQQGAGDELRICRIDVESSLTPNNLLESCLRAFGVDDIEIAQSNDFKSLLINRLKRLKKLNIQPLLLVDNVEHARPDLFSFISESLSWRDEDGFLFAAILTASRVMPEWDSLHGRTQRVDLPPLSEQEIPLYLMHRLTAAGYQGELPFSSKDLKQFYRHSAGCPAKVNQLAHQKLLGITPNQGFESIKLPKLLPLLKWIAMGILVLSLIVLLIFQDQINALFTGMEKNTDGFSEQLILPKQNDEIATVIVGEDEVTSSEQADREELASLVATLSADEKTKSSGVGTETTSSSTQEVITDTAAPDTSVSKATVSSPSHNEAWILQQRSTDYTFQLMGSWEHVEVVEFIDKYALAGDVAEFQSMRNGRVWYALIYGVYSDKKTALQASKQWPAPLNTLPSWLRRFDSVQKQIKDMGQVQ